MVTSHPSCLRLVPGGEGQGAYAWQRQPVAFSRIQQGLVMLTVSLSCRRGKLARKLFTSRVTTGGKRTPSMHDKEAAGGLPTNIALAATRLAHQLL